MSQNVTADRDAIINQPDAMLNVAHAVYPRRFWVLFVLSLVSCQQSCLWLTYSPVEDEAKLLYGWSSANIDFFAAWGPGVYAPVVLFAPWVVDRLGLRSSVTLGAFLSCLGACCR